jgi:hypothetical protein
MPALSLQFKFALGTGTSTATHVAIPSTAFSSEGTKTFKSQREKGNGYYSGGTGFHTVSHTVTPNFLGTITTQATLATAPLEGDWFDVISKSYTNDLSNMPVSTTTNYSNFIGNFVWVRSVVQYNPESIESGMQWINYNH